MGLDGAFALPQNLCNLSDAMVLEESHQEYFPLHTGQRVHHRSDLPPELLLHEPIDGFRIVSLVVIGLRVQIPIINILEDPRYAFPPVVIPHPVNGDAEQPASKEAHIPEAGQVLEGLKEDILRDILCSNLRTDTIVNHPEDLILV